MAAAVAAGLLVATAAWPEAGPMEAPSFAAAVPSPVPSPVPAPTSPTVVFRLPVDEPVIFHGMTNFEASGFGASPFPYPVVGGPAGLAISLVAGIATHAFVTESRRKAQQQRQQEASDQILAPYEGVISGFAQRDLLERGLARIATDAVPVIAGADADAVRPDGWIVEYEPVFGVKADGRALVLDNAISVRSPVAGRGSFQNTVRVVSTPTAADDPEAFWSSDGGTRLKDTSARLLARSLEIALDIALQPAGRPAADTASPPGGPPPERTVRYRFGDEHRSERGEVIVAECRRILLRTLRGGLMSVPSTRTDCPTDDGSKAIDD